jgi:GNAT superfamily N-acetyltransferase
VTIRPATAADASDLARLLTELGHATTAEEVTRRWPAFTASGNRVIVAMLADGTVAGAATLHQTVVLQRPKPVGRITALVVGESARGHGIGRALVAAAEAALVASGCGLIEVTSNVARAGAHAFYLHLGYDQTSVRFSKLLG